MKNTKKILPLLVFVALMLLSACTNSDRKYSDWESMRQHQTVPDWLRDGKFGIYFHWGVYSVPAFVSEWYPRFMYFDSHPIHKYHQESYPDMEYHDFVPLFKAQNFDAQTWAKLFKASGARFAGPVAEHCDGFSMWDSDVTPWNAKDMGPMRDITGEIAQAIRDQGMKVITTFHHARNIQLYQDKYETESAKTIGQFVNSHFPYNPNAVTSTTDSKLRMLYGNMTKEKWYEDVWFAKLKEVIDNYSPDIIWFDSWLKPNIPDEYLQEFAAYYLNEADEKKQDVAIVAKFDLPKHVAMENYEHLRKTNIDNNPWMSDESIGKDSWGYTQDLKMKHWEDLLHLLIDIVSKNGTFLLNISPMADGTIPQDQQDVLLSLGEWLGRYGEAIYGTRTWFTHGEGSMKKTAREFDAHLEDLNVKYASNNIRYTVKDNVIYAIMLDVPDSDQRTLLRAFASQNTSKFRRIEKVELLGTSLPVEWELINQGLVLNVNHQMPDVAANVYKITVENYEYIVVE